MPTHAHAPGRLSSALFRCKAAAHRLLRAAEDLARGVRRHGRGRPAAFPRVLAESRAPLWSDEPAVERAMQTGKVQNLRCALRRLDRTEVRAGAVFSFWGQIGRATRRRGYVAGRTLREGCLIPTVGGGLCQLSNALYDAALLSGLDVIERHAHSAIVPGSAAERGRDATVAWNYVDLRFRASERILIEARLTRDELIVRFRGREGAALLRGDTPRNPPGRALPRPSR